MPGAVGVPPATYTLFSLLCRDRMGKIADQSRSYAPRININDNPDSMKYVEQVNGGKQIIPTIVFEDGSVLTEPTNAELAEKLDIQPKATRQYFEVIIIGSGPAGLTAAIYAAREGFDTLVIERSGVGGQAGVTERIDNYPGFPDGVGGAELADQLRTHAERFGVEILPAQAVSKITSMGDYRFRTTETGDEYCASAVIVATVSKYRRLNVPGEEDLIGACIHFCATCDRPFNKDREVVVVGGGNSGIEESLFLTKFVKKSHGARVRRPPSCQPLPVGDGRQKT